MSTCNRTEIYAVAEKFHGAYQDVRDLFSDLTFLPAAEFVDHLTVEWDTEAARHLFEVAAGLDSVVIGEHEILGQVRDSWETARRHGAAGPTLNLLFRLALETGKRARTETAISRSVTSVSQAAVVMAAERLDGLDGRTAVVLGAGAMGRGMVTLLADGGVDEVIVVNRSLDRAAELAEHSRGRAAAFSALADELAHADVLFTSTAAPMPLLGVDEVRAAMAARDGRPLLIVDIAMPRDVEPAVARARRRRPARHGRHPGLRRPWVWPNGAVRCRPCGPSSTRSSTATSPLARRVPSPRSSPRCTGGPRASARASSSGSRRRSPSSTRPSASSSRRITRGIVAKLVHVPTVRLKDASGSLRGERLSEALRDLLDL